MNIIFLNNKFIPAEQANISVADRGFLLGDGLFETMRSYNGKVLFLEQHWQRLTKSAKFLEIPLIHNVEEIKNIVEDLLKHNQLAQKEAAVRITVTRGISERGLAFPKISQPTLLIAAFPYQSVSKDYKLIVSSIRRNEFSPLSQIKCLNYLDNILAYQEALKQQADDAIMLNTQGHVACTTTANIFMVKNEILFTPKITDGALPGIMRGAILKLMTELNISGHEESTTLENLKDADEVFITNSLRGINKISIIDDVVMKDKIITEKLISLLKATLV